MLTHALKVIGAILLGFFGLIVLAAIAQNDDGEFVSTPSSSLQSSSNEPTRLLYDSDENSPGIQQLYLRDLADNSDTQLTTRTDVHSFFGTISPDGERIVHLETPSDDKPENYAEAAIVTIDSTGANRTVVRSAPDTHNWTFQAHPEWSPDSQSIVFTGGSGRPGDHFNIYILTLENNSLEKITSFNTGLAIDPSFHPNGQSIVFSGCDTAGCFPDGLDVYSVDIASKTVTKLNTLSQDLPEYDPYISPDGSRIGWLVQTAQPKGLQLLGQWGVAIADFEGTSLSNQQYAINDGNVNSKPNWSPDSNHIYFHRLRYFDDTKFGIWRMSPDGSNLERLIGDTTAKRQYPDVW